jgi:ABC-type transporter Mla subunit MlaD
VQGLDRGAAVKYRGVAAGRVERIDIAPDGDLIEVKMSIDNRYADLLFKDPTLRAQLQLSGITGCATSRSTAAPATSSRTRRRSRSSRRRR